MSTMPATSGHSEACCNTPPVVATGYERKGTMGGPIGDNTMQTYVTGPDDATKGVVLIMDIFGFKDQTIQGADILATSADQKYKVAMPDWFHGSPCPVEWFPPDTDEKKKDLGAFLGKNPPAEVAKQLPAFVKGLQAKYPSVKSWGVLGMCWGGKVVSLVTAADDNPFAVGAEVHPAMVDPKDAAGVKVPIVMLASKDEDPKAVDGFEAGLTVPKHVETFKDQVHGWMAARADLEDARGKAEYARGYKTVLDFWGKEWK